MAREETLGKSRRLVVKPKRRGRLTSSCLSSLAASATAALALAAAFLRLALTDASCIATLSRTATSRFPVPRTYKISRFPCELRAEQVGGTRNRTFSSFSLDTTSLQQEARNRENPT